MLILSQYAEPAFAAALLADSPGRRGYLLKERILHPDHLVSALYRIAAGQTVVDPAVIDAAMSSATTNRRLAGLSARELEVLHLLAQDPARGEPAGGDPAGDAMTAAQRLPMLARCT